MTGELSHTQTRKHKLFFGFRVKTLETAGRTAAADGDVLLVNQRREPSSSSSSSLLGHINTDRVSRHAASGPLLLLWCSWVCGRKQEADDDEAQKQ